MKNSHYFIAAFLVAITIYTLLCTVQDQLPIRFFTKRTPTCSMEVIKKYCIDHNYFPTGGRWINSSYFPDLCRFPSTNITKERLRECLTRRNVKKVVVLGDSNGVRYFGATMKLLQTFMPCKTVKREDGVYKPDVKYFTNGTKLKASDIVVHNRDCGGCTSIAVKCSHNTMEITIEYISMEYYMDTEITTVRNLWQHNCHPSKNAPTCRQSNSYQEFIFSEYLEDNYPDVILLFSGSHDYLRYGLTKIRGDMEYLKMLIKKYVPEQTKLFWFSRISQYPKQKRESEEELNVLIERSNLELFDVLRTEFVETDGRILPFFDVFDMSLGVRDWAVDGVHRKSEWYAVVLSSWMQTFCET